MHLFKLGLPHASCCQVKGRRLLKALFPNQTIRENKMNSAFVTMRFRSSRYAGETLSPRGGCLYESGNEDWGEEITEEICFWNVYTRPFLLAVWKMLSAKWRASWRLSLNWWLLRFCARGPQKQIWNVMHAYCFCALSSKKKSVFQTWQLWIGGNNTGSSWYLKVAHSSWGTKLHLELLICTQQCSFHPGVCVL